MRYSRCPERVAARRRAFTLLEVLIALAIVAMLASALAIPLAAQVHMRRVEDTRRLLGEARDALLGFAAAHGRLPCPATAGSRGRESFAAGGDAGDGRCASFHGGWLPAATLGLAPLDPEGFVRDAWGSAANRVRYAVHGGAIQGVAHALTRAGGMQMATLPGLGAAPHYLYICATGVAANASGCGPAANQLTRRAAFVLVAPGLNAPRDAAAGSDEARNLDGDAVFVSREASMAAGREFDDLLDWGAIHAVVNRMVLAGRLP
ncbi:MAG TPA: type II secretion system protein [Myxococcota bacterium]|nr:type II secretion system protein [Myxococcota bacterium]